MKQTAFPSLSSIGGCEGGYMLRNDGEYVLFLIPDKIKGTPDSEIRPNEERGRIKADNDTLAITNIKTLSSIK